MDPHEANRRVFDRTDVVGSYAGTTGLSAHEAELLQGVSWSRVLDLGVGTGRTTGALAQGTKLYVGLDYAPEMTLRAKRLHPDLPFVIADAARLACFRDGTFDLVVFSYNGIDYLHPNALRAACLDHVHRLLAPGGHFLFSSHRPRPVLVPPATDGPAARRLAAALLRTSRRLLRLTRTGAFWRGHGYVLDPARGGLLTHTASTRAVVRELEGAGFSLIRHLPVGGYDRVPSLSADWEYYLFVA